MQREGALPGLDATDEMMKVTFLLGHLSFSFSASSASSKQHARHARAGGTAQQNESELCVAGQSASQHSTDSRNVTCLTFGWSRCRSALLLDDGAGGADRSLTRRFVGATCKCGLTHGELALQRAARRPGCLSPLFRASVRVEGVHGSFFLSQKSKKFAFFNVGRFQLSICH